MVDRPCIPLFCHQAEIINLRLHFDRFYFLHYFIFIFFLLLLLLRLWAMRDLSICVELGLKIDPFDTFPINFLLFESDSALWIQVFFWYVVVYHILINVYQLFGDVAHVCPLVLVLIRWFILLFLLLKGCLCKI
jgi:hypothetical protein